MIFDVAVGTIILQMSHSRILTFQASEEDKIKAIEQVLKPCEPHNFSDLNCFKYSQQ